MILGQGEVNIGEDEILLKLARAHHDFTVRIDNIATEVA